MATSWKEYPKITRCPVCQGQCHIYKDTLFRCEWHYCLCGYFWTGSRHTSKVMRCFAVSDTGISSNTCTVTVASLTSQGYGIPPELQNYTEPFECRLLCDLPGRVSHLLPVSPAPTVLIPLHGRLQLSAILGEEYLMGRPLDKVILCHGAENIAPVVSKINDSGAIGIAAYERLEDPDIIRIRSYGDVILVTTDFKSALEPAVKFGLKIVTEEPLIVGFPSVWARNTVSRAETWEEAFNRQILKLPRDRVRKWIDSLELSPSVFSEILSTVPLEVTRRIVSAKAVEVIETKPYRKVSWQAPNGWWTRCLRWHTVKVTDFTLSDDLGSIVRGKAIRQLTDEEKAAMPNPPRGFKVFRSKTWSKIFKALKQRQEQQYGRVKGYTQRGPGGLPGGFDEEANQEGRPGPSTAVDPEGQAERGAEDA